MNDPRHLVVGTAGVLLGTVAGQRTLARIPDPVFRRIVAAIVLALGIGLLVQSA